MKVLRAVQRTIHLRSIEKSQKGSFMLIEKFAVPANELIDVGLQPIEMNRLGQFVALTGKNGAGKSRLLNKLAWYISTRNNQISTLDSLENEIKRLTMLVSSEPNHPHHEHWKLSLVSQQSQYAVVKERIFSAKDEQLGVLHFVPKQLNLVDSKGHNKNSVIGFFNQAKNPGLTSFETVCFSYIQTVQDREFEATHPRNTHDTNTKNAAIEEYEQLVKLVDLLLKAKIQRSFGDATIFGKPLAEAGLSDGQKVLIQLAVALHAQKGKLDNTVFLLDEPENHLHPSALIEFLDSLEAAAKNSQLWIATHSVPLLAHIANKEAMSIWYVEDGHVSNAGSKPEKVLRGLLGNDEQIDNLNTFTALPAQYAAISFAAECLTSPKVIGVVAGDPQIAQIGSVLSFDANAQISLLDFGAGKSRLLSGLVECAAAQEKNLKDCLNYFAFDSNPVDREYGLASIESVYGSDTNRHFLTVDSYFESKDDAIMDVVVMCNVLHEIPPNEWLNLFSVYSLIVRSLKNTGYLLVVEDQRIPTGEKLTNLDLWFWIRRT